MSNEDVKQQITKYIKDNQISIEIKGKINKDGIEEIELGAYLKVLTNFYKIIRALEKEITGKKPTIRWLISDMNFKGTGATK